MVRQKPMSAQAKPAQPKTGVPKVSEPRALAVVRLGGHGSIPRLAGSERFFTLMIHWKAGLKLWLSYPGVGRGPMVDQTTLIV